MDVAAYNWATAASSPAGPMSAKSAILMRNATIFVAKHTKNFAKNGAWQSTLSLSLSLKQSHHLEQRQRPTFEIWSSIEREFWSFGGPLHWCIDCTVHVVVAVMSRQEMDGVRSFGASNSFVEDLPQPVEGNMQEDTPESVRNSVIEPRVGMEFDSLQQVIEFYKHYAYSKGFATMTRNSRKKKGFSETSYVNLKCNREGKYSSSVDDPSKKRSTIKNACEAGIKASMDITDKKWRILSFIEDHNHELSPSKSRHFAAFRHISTDTRRRLLINDNAWQWLQSMCDIAPKAIITDQCQAMRRAIEIVFPETVHRWCIWHITMKLPVKLAGLEAYQDIKHYLLKAVHDSMTVEEFEEKWNHTITLHHLEENEWLAKLYEERERWVPAFLNSNFFAGMSSTQRSESMNAFFDGYLHSSTTLKVFVEQFEKAMRNKVEKEILSDFECFKGKLECSSSSPMEKQFQEAYTHEIFKRVRLEFAGRQGCIVNELVRGGDEVKYKIEDEACPGKLFEDNFSRSCGKQPSSQRKNSVGAAPDVVRTEVVRSPMVVKRKGRPRMKRLKSSMEEAVSKPKKKRNTAVARNLAHSTSTTGVGGSAYGDCSTSNMSMSQTQAHGNEDQALNLT
uniref:Protein FAR1-RELATED SEQUENCE n=1 Tax=Fagus sylvatica TaxID=28930 RepID=A0A2N9FCB0_FAGSY